MSNVDQIKAAINALPKLEYIQLRQWFSEMDWQLWDQQIQEGSDAGTLDFLIKEALDEKENGSLKEL
jgi:hypothetical protein